MIIYNYILLLSTLVNCGDPIPPTNGSLGSYVHTREGATVTYWCNDGFRPSAIFPSTCNSTARWTPDPEQHNCTFIRGTVFYTVLTISSAPLEVKC